MDIEYTPRDKNISSDAIYSLILKAKTKYTQKYNYTMQMFSEMYNVEKILEGTFPLK